MNKPRKLYIILKQGYTVAEEEFVEVETEDGKSVCVQRSKHPTMRGYIRLGPFTEAEETSGNGVEGAKELVEAE